MKRMLAVLFPLAMGVALVAASASGARLTVAKTYRLTARMNTNQVVTPKNKRWTAPAPVKSARGTFAATLDAKTRKLAWRISYTRVGAGATYAQIHIGRPGRFGLIIVRLCSSCNRQQSGVVRIRRPFVDQFALANTWVTVLTTKYPNGVIRGQIKLVG